MGQASYWNKNTADLLVVKRFILKQTIEEQVHTFIWYLIKVLLSSDLVSVNSDSSRSNIALQVPLESSGVEAHFLQISSSHYR